MNRKRTLYWSIVVVATIALCAGRTTCAVAHPGGGGGHGGGERGGGERGASGGERRGGDADGRGGDHQEAHPYQPSANHAEHHAAYPDARGGARDGNRDNFANHNHHHSDWHQGVWGPGNWGSNLGYGYDVPSYTDGATYVDNSTLVTPVINNSDNSYVQSTDENGNTAANAGTDPKFPVDAWPELGVATYAGQYGQKQGQVVVRLDPESAAARAGFVPGDVILSLNGRPVASADDMDSALDGAGGQFTAEVWDARTKRTSTLAGALGPNAPQGNAAVLGAPQ